jgi:serine/threonine protein kinase
MDAKAVSFSLVPSVGCTAASGRVRAACFVKEFSAESWAMIGQTISHYEVIEELGRGGTGIVYKARDTLLDRVLALKLLRGESILPARVRRFIQEAKSAYSLNHPNIVTIYEVFYVGEAPCIAMEYAARETSQYGELSIELFRRFVLLSLPRHFLYLSVRSPAKYIGQAGSDRTRGSDKRIDIEMRLR